MNKKRERELEKPLKEGTLGDAYTIKGDGVAVLRANRLKADDAFVSELSKMRNLMKHQLRRGRSSEG